MALNLPTSSILSEKLSELELIECFQEPSKDEEPKKDEQITIVSLEHPISTTGTCNICTPHVDIVKSEEDVYRLCGSSHGLHGKDYSARFIFLTQAHSFSPMSVSRETMKTLMIEHNVCTEFLKIASAFCARVYNTEDSLCLPFRIRQSSDLLEYMYAFKYPEQADRAGAPWSLRQTAVYHQIRLSDGRSTYILISPYLNTKGQAAASAWFSKFRSISQVRSNAFAIHSILFDQYLPNYRPFSSSLEERTEELSSKMLSVGLKHIDSVTPQDMNDLGRIRLKLLPQPRALSGLARTIEELQLALRTLSETQMKLDPKLVQQWQESLIDQGRDIISYKENACAVLEKCDIASQILTGILEFNNRSIAKQQNDRVSLLTQFTVEDSITVRVVTAISLVFLSFATVAAIFAMPIFYLDKTSHKLAVSPSIWIFALAGVVLTCCTLGYWQWRSQRRQQRRERLLDKIRDAV